MTERTQALLDTLVSAKSSPLIDLPGDWEEMDEQSIRDFTEQSLRKTIGIFNKLANLELWIYQSNKIHELILSRYRSDQQSDLPKPGERPSLASITLPPHDFKTEFMRHISEHFLYSAITDVENSIDDLNNYHRVLYLSRIFREYDPSLIVVDYSKDVDIQLAKSPVHRFMKWLLEVRERLLQKAVSAHDQITQTQTPVDDDDTDDYENTTKDVESDVESNMDYADRPSMSHLYLALARCAWVLGSFSSSKDQLHPKTLDDIKRAIENETYLIPDKLNRETSGFTTVTYVHRLAKKLSGRHILPERYTGRPERFKQLVIDLISDRNLS